MNMIGRFNLCSNGGPVVSSKTLRISELNDVDSANGEVGNVCNLAYERTQRFLIDVITLWKVSRTL